MQSLLSVNHKFKSPGIHAVLVFCGFFILIGVSNRSHAQNNVFITKDTDVYPHTQYIPTITQPENVSHIKNDLELQNLLGRVKELRETPTIDTTAQILRPDNMKHLWQFNPFGYISLYADYNDTIFIVGTKDSAMKFNAKGQKTEYSVDDANTHKVQYLCRFSYSDNGKLKEKLESDLYYRLKQITHYDDNGNETGGEVINSDSSLQFRWIVNYQYSNRRRTQIARIQISKGRSDTTFYNYTYNGMGYVNEEEIDGRTKSFSGKYDSLNRPVELVYYGFGGHIDIFVRYKYDEHNNPIEENHYDADGKIGSESKMVYEYDNTGNWTKQTIYNNGKVINVLTRVIQYY